MAPLGRCAVEVSCEAIGFWPLRVISPRHNNLVAFRAKQTFSEPRFQNRIYEHAP